MCAGNHNAGAKGKPNVVASSAFLADWAREIGGDLVNIETIHDGRSDIHTFEPRPGHIMKCAKADLFIAAGLDLDVWIQSLLDASRNSRIQYGAKGYVDASHGVLILQKTDGPIDMSMGDVHPYGNPHYFYSLENVEIALDNITKGLSGIAPENAETFKVNMDRYLDKAKNTFALLKKMMEPFKGAKVVAYHMSWEYFIMEFGLNIAGYFELKPGIPPSPRHVQELTSIIGENSVKIILKEPYFPKKSVKKVSKATGAVVVELVNFPGGRPNAPTFLENLKANVNELIKALK